MVLFDSGLTRRKESLPKSSIDPYDVRIGDMVLFEDKDYANANFVIVGCPQDEGVKRNGGRPGAAAAPELIRSCLYKLSSHHLSKLKLFDAGNICIQSTLEKTHAVQVEIIKKLLQHEKRVIIIGGGNDISYPDCSALASVFENILVFNIDAHFDVRDNRKCNSGTPYRQLLSNGCIIPENFYQIGCQDQSNSPVYLQYLLELGVHAISREDLRGTALEVCLRNALNTSAEAIFWGFDLDVVISSEAPGVSAPNATGISGNELCSAASIAGTDPRTRIIEFSEVNPNYDHDNRTSRLTATAIYQYLRSCMNLI